MVEVLLEILCRSHEQHVLRVGLIPHLVKERSVHLEKYFWGDSHGEAVPDRKNGLKIQEMSVSTCIEG